MTDQPGEPLPEPGERTVLQEAKDGLRSIHVLTQEEVDRMIAGRRAPADEVNP